MSVWSPDSARLAFLWNDQGLPFRDIWVFSIADRQLTRVTNLATTAAAKPAASSQSPHGDFESLVNDAASRALTGVSEVLWTPDGTHLLFVHDGKLNRVNRDGSDVQPVPGTKPNIAEVEFSPDGKIMTFLSEGKLWLADQTGEARSVEGGPAAGPRVGVRVYKWSPDSRRIALQFSDRSKSRQLIIPDYLPEEVVARPQRRDYTYDKFAAERFGIYTAATNALRMLDLREPRSATGQLHWSPDGQRLLIDRNGPDAPSRWILVARAEDGIVREPGATPARIAATRRRGIRSGSTTGGPCWRSRISMAGCTSAPRSKAERHGN